MRDDYDEPDDDFLRTPAYPSSLRAAGIIWIIFGGLLLVNVAIILVASAVLAEGKDKEPALVGGVCGGILAGLFGAAFIYVGVQSINGTAQDTLGNGIGSIIFGLLNAAGFAVQLGAGQILQAGIYGICAAGLITAGILALVGRDAYKTWRRAQKARRAREPLDD